VVRSTPRRADISSRRFERILLIKPSSLGDVVHALPVLHALRARFAEARIDWLIASSLAELIDGHPAVNHAVRFDRQRFGRIGLSPRITAEFLRFLADLRRRRYDLVIDLQGLFRSGFLARATGSDVRVGMHEAREGAGLFYTHRAPECDRDAHAVDRCLSIGQLLGFPDAPACFDLALPNAIVDEAERLLRTAGAKADDLLVAMVPGARWETKRWPVERFARVVDILHESPGVRCVLLGGESERGLCRQIVLQSERPAVDLSGHTGLRLLAAVLSRADVVLCHDSGAMHLATAMGRPLVCLVGPTNPRRTGPYRRETDVLRVELECAPCYLRRLSQCPYEHRCMMDLEVERVVEALHAALGNRRSLAAESMHFSK